MEEILVTDAEQRSALAAVRALGRAGYRVHVCSTEDRPLAGASRHARSVYRVPSAKDSREDFVRRVGDLVDSLGVAVVLPATEPAMLALLDRRQTLEPAVVPFGSPEAFRALSDKARVTEAARTIGLPVPHQRLLADAAPEEAAGMTFPLVVKPSRSTVASGNQLLEQSVSHVASHSELRRVLQSLPEAAFPVLLQERISGPGMGIFLLRWNGEPRAVFAHRRIREKPPSGGVSVYRESVEADPDLVARSEELLERFGWSGVAMVEYKRDADTGVPYVMEVNARLWGSLQLAVDAGVDFPRLLVEAALGAPAPTSPGYRTGVRCRWWWGDVDHLIARLRGQSPGDTD